MARGIKRPPVTTVRKIKIPMEVVKDDLNKVTLESGQDRKRKSRNEEKK